MRAYEAREVRSRDRIKVEDVDLKVYELFAANRRNDVLPEPVEFERHLSGIGDLFSSTSTHLGHAAGFVIAHYASDGDYLLASRWCGVNMLRHQVFALKWRGNPESIELAPLSIPDIIACVWELEVIKFERDQWVRTAMSDPSDSPSVTMLNRYLNATFSAYV